MSVWNRVFDQFVNRLPSTRRKGRCRRPLEGARASLSGQVLEERYMLSAWVATDKGDYAPGQTATISAGGFAVGETVSLQVVHNDGSDASNPAHQPWLVQDGGAGDLDGLANGQIETTWAVGTSERNATLDLTAVGTTSHLTATTTFTDAPQLGSLTVGSQTGSLTYGTGGSVTYLVTVNRGSGAGSTGAFVADLDVTTSLPAGVTFSFDTSSLSFSAGDDTLTATLTLTSSNGTPASNLAFTVQAEVQGNTADLVTGSGQFVVSPKLLTGSIIANDKVYDGTTVATFTGNLAGVIAGDVVNYVGGTVLFDSKNVGVNRTVTATGMTLSGADAGNYVVNTTATDTANITVRTLVGTVTVADKTFDGTTAATITARNLSNAISGDDVTLIGGTATFADATIGTNKTVNVIGLSLSGADAVNYTVNSTATDTASITSALSIGPLITNDMPNTKDELVAIPVTDTANTPVTVTVSSSNSNVTATVLTGNQSIRLTVTGVDGNGQAFSGDLTFQLFQNEAPITTARIIQLINNGFYNGLTFHRVIQDFVAQGGDPTGTGSGGSGTTLPDEFNSDLTFTSNGLLAMANSGHDTGDSQFFITDVDETLAQLPQHLNFQHTIFGILTSGFDVFRKLIATPVDANDKPTTPVVIQTASVFTDTQNAVVRLHTATAGFTGSTTLTVNASDNNGGSAQTTKTINVVADTVGNTNSSGRAFLGTVTNQTTNQGTPVTFNVQGTDLEKDPLTFVVRDGTTFGTAANVSVSIQVTPASGSTPATAAITLTPTGTFTGTLTLMVGVRDQTDRSGTGINTQSNFDTQKFTLTVNPVNHAPTTQGGSVSTQPGQAVSVQLTGDDGDSDKTQTLSFEIVSQPAHGTISGFNTATGALQYTPNAGFVGVDTFMYRVHDDGGTANGGTDTGAITPFTINVAPPTPTGLALAPTSDDGLFNDDRVIGNWTPTFTVNATAGSTVRLLVNGTANVNTTETSPGVFTATLTRDMLKVGANQITATAQTNGAVSNPTAALGFTFAPSYEEVYTVPGDFHSSMQITFTLTSRSSFRDDEFGVYSVDDLQGRVDGMLPGDPGYAAAALSPARRQIVFITSDGANKTFTFNVHGGDTFAFYLVQDGTTTEYYRRNPNDNARGSIHLFFGAPGGNPDGGVDHLRTVGDPQTGKVQLMWEDGWRGGDGDFNDMVITIGAGPAPAANVGDTLRIPGGPPDNASVKFTLEPTHTSPNSDSNSGGGSTSSSSGASKGEFGFFVVSDDAGTLNGLSPNSPGYLQAVMNSSTRQVVFHDGDPVGTQQTLQIPGGALIAWYYVPGHSLSDVVSDNPNNDSGHDDFALFSFDSANPDNSEHFSWVTPASSRRQSTGTDLQLHVLDQLFASRQRFDDLLVGIDLP